MEELLKVLFLTSCAGTALALFLEVCRPLTKKVFSASWHYYMWLAVLLIMMVPLRITLPEPMVQKSTSEQAMFLPQAEQGTGEFVILDDDEPPVVQNLVEAVERQQGRIEETIMPFLFGSWLMIAVFLLFIRIVSYLLLLRNIRKNSVLVDCPQIRDYTKRCVQVRVSNSLCSPLLLGVFRPTLLLPGKELFPEQLHYVLAHECVHLQRQDVLYKWFLTLVKCIHWFNPVMYWIAGRVNLDCELSCDRAVVRGNGENETKAYAETILALLSGSNTRQIPLTTGMTGKKKALKQRFYLLKENKNISKRVTILSIVLALLIAAGGWIASGILNGKMGNSPKGLQGLNTAERQGEECTILVEGVDQAGRPDAIIAFHFDRKMLTCMNIPRNTEYIREGDDSIRTISDYLVKNKQPQAAIDAVQELFAFPIHYYARVEMEAVEKMVDAIGGIEFDIPYDMIYDDPHQDLHINLTAGRQRLSGEQVVHLLRFRDRSAENDEEIRRMTWFSVMEEMLSQAVFGNRLPDVKRLYQAATEHIETNYPMEEFIKDLGKLQNSNRNNVVFGSVRGRNLVADGRFVFRINHVASTPLLQVFHAEASAEKLVSTISYQNDVMGFSLKLPERWKNGYDAVQFHHQVVFYHKEIFEKYGKGSGMLFSITKVERPEEKSMEELEALGDCLYRTKESGYYWNIASDVQYPIWTDRDEEDVWMAEDFEEMLEDITFIKNSFSFLEGTEESKMLTTRQ